MGQISSTKSLSKLIEQKAKDIAELNRLINEQEYLRRRLRINQECVEFMKFAIACRDSQIAKNGHLVEPWSVGYYSHDAD